ncbi:MAG TPA: hypothetical protein PKL53_07100 [Methylotenera sp.]|nr:hypothetical protein [Methylotenera sp.]HPV45505.1 hypothetical protein [Methylotenera sp.]
MRKIHNGYISIILLVLFTLCSCTVEHSDSENLNQGIDTPKIFNRDEFKKKVMGLSGAFVIQELGKPDSTSESGGTEYWYYHQRSIDTVTGNVDNTVQIVFDSQSKQVSQINF